MADRTAGNAACVLGVAALIVGGVAGVSLAHPPVGTGDVMLAASGTTDLGGGTALIMGPGGWPEPNQTYMDAIDQNYLAPMGFHGNLEAVTDSWSNLFENYSRMGSEVDSLVAAVNQQMATGDFSAENPLVIVGYSESAIAASQAMAQLHAEGIPTDELHFVLIGDTASPDGGFLSSFVPSLPEWLQEPAEQVLSWFGIDGDLLGATTPTDLYPTDIYTIPGDLWSQWPDDLSDPSALSYMAAGFFTHLDYIGLTQQQIDDATLSHSDGLIDYYTIPDTDLNPLAALWGAAVNMGDVPDWLNQSVNALFG